MNYCDFFASYWNLTFHGTSYTRWGNAQTFENFDKSRSCSLSQMENIVNGENMKYKCLD